MPFLRRGRLLAPRPTPLAYRSTANTSNAPTITKPASVAAGDLVIIVTGIGSDPTISTATGSTWSKSSSATQRLFWKVLTATDVSNVWNSSDPNTYATAVAYSNAGVAVSSVTVKSSADAGPSVSSLTVAGFARSAGGRPRAVIAAISGDNSGNVPGTPTGFTGRASSGSICSAIADRMLGYSGESTTWTGLTNGASNSYSARLLEVL